MLQNSACKFVLSLRKFLILTVCMFKGGDIETLAPMTDDWISERKTCANKVVVSENRQTIINSTRDQSDDRSLKVVLN